MHTAWVQFPKEKKYLCIDIKNFKYKDWQISINTTNTLWPRAEQRTISVFYHQQTVRPNIKWATLFPVPQIYWIYYIFISLAFGASIDIIDWWRRRGEGEYGCQIMWPGTRTQWQIWHLLTELGSSYLIQLAHCLLYTSPDSPPSHIPLSLSFFFPLSLLTTIWSNMYSTLKGQSRGSFNLCFFL